ncbi:Na+/H+ antiporter subunit E [uncultured Pseudokineococcus sp.]|uniref:Na+/H+ antiporter subunit E n=1 Tax=uncultured Pseudokineococcus sp. TaxID=1642928 RepID=UPI0026356BA5|nr:Na+/H+ antiporter subunit E [uncultured Pseudokineococcus sp.]
MSVLRQLGRLVAFTAWYLGRFLSSNLVVTREVVSPGTDVAPAVLDLLLRCRTDVEVASYIALVGLTPGTLVLSSDDQRERGGGARVGVHVMHAADAGQARAELRDLEARLLRALRRHPDPLPPEPDESGRDQDPRAPDGPPPADPDRSGAVRTEPARPARNHPARNDSARTDPARTEED